MKITIRRLNDGDVSLVALVALALTVLSIVVVNVIFTSYLVLHESWSAEVEKLIVDYDKKDKRIVVTNVSASVVRIISIWVIDAKDRHIRIAIEGDEGTLRPGESLVKSMADVRGLRVVTERGSAFTWRSE